MSSLQARRERQSELCWPWRAQLGWYKQSAPKKYHYNIVFISSSQSIILRVAFKELTVCTRNERRKQIDLVIHSQDTCFFPLNANWQKNFCELNWAMTSAEVIALRYYKKVSTARKYSCHQSRREEKVGCGFQNWCDEGIEAEEPILPFEGSEDVLGVFQTSL